jgi:(p)ppGpp synthase/HD superfamily hydrolase
MTRLGQAISIAAEVHKDQVDKGGEPYILHPLAVMQKVADSYTAELLREELLCAAVLHDAYEDYRRGRWISKDQLADEVLHTLGPVVHDVVGVLSHRPKSEENYDEYIERVARSWMATIIKIADLSHNLDTTRLPSGQIKEADFERWDKYHRALVRLSREST